MNNSTEKQNVPEKKVPAKDIVLWVGIDWADQKHCLVTRRPDGSDSKLHWVDQKPQKLDDFFLELRQKHSTGRIGVVLEQSRGALLYALLKYPFLRLYPVNPRCLADFRNAMIASGAKGDPSDADLLCELGCKHGERLRELELQDEATRQLVLLNEHRRGIVDEQTGLSNQLGSALKCFYPLILELFEDDIVAAIALDFMERWPNLAAAKKAKPGVLRSFFHNHNSRSEEKIQERINAIGEAKPLTEDAAVNSCMQLLVQTLIVRLRAVQSSIAQYDERIKVVFACHAKAQVFASFPGVGPVFGPRLAAAFGTSLANFPDPYSMLCWSGVGPVQIQSGKTKVINWRWARPKFLHQTFVEYARTSVLFCPWAKEFFKSRTEKGWGKFRIYRALAFKWIRILWRCWNDNVRYDEAKYLAGLQKRGIKLYASLYASPATKSQSE
jgi:transposase